MFEYVYFKQICGQLSVALDVSVSFISVFSANVYFEMCFLSVFEHGPGKLCSVPLLIIYMWHVSSCFSSNEKFDLKSHF